MIAGVHIRKDFRTRGLMAITTRIIKDITRQGLEDVIKCLKDGFPVAIPTETVYGLAANALDTVACSRIYKAKQRPSDNPLIVHICDRSDVDSHTLGLVRQTNSDHLCSSKSSAGQVENAKNQNISSPLLSKGDYSEDARKLMDTFWPGPLTILLPKGPKVPDVVSAGLDTVGVRMPNHPVALQIIHSCGFPLAAPSANLSGRPSPTTAAHVYYDLNNRIDYIVDGGSCDVGLESTVVDVTVRPPLLLRPGGITLDQLRAVVPEIVSYDSVKSDQEISEMIERPSTPGMKYRHYAPEAPIHLFYPVSHASCHKLMNQFIIDLINEGKDIVHIIIKDGDFHNFSNCLSSREAQLYKQISLSNSGNLGEIAHNLFAVLREADSLKPNIIVTEAPSQTEYSDEAGEIMAIMNRLAKAASFHHREM